MSFQQVDEGGSLMDSCWIFCRMSDPIGYLPFGIGARGEVPPQDPTLIDAIASLMNTRAEQARLLSLIF